MADYVKSNILCQAYLKIDNPTADKSSYPELRNELTTFAQRRSEFILYPEVITDVRFSEGSLVEYVTIAGSLFVALKAYPDFRKGVNQLYSDVKRLAESMILEAQFMSRARSSTIARAEARPGVVGTLKDLIDSIDRTRLSAGSVRVKTLSGQVGRSRDEAERLLKLFKDRRDVRLVAEKLGEIVGELPPSPTDPKQKAPEKKHLSEYTATIADFQKTLHEFLHKADVDLASEPDQPD